MLHSKPNGKSYVRVINLRLNVSDNHSDVLNSCDEYSLVNYLIKSIDLIKNGVNGTIKEITNKIVKIFNYHRKNMTENKTAVLVVPEMLRTLPLHMIGLMKLP